MKLDFNPELLSSYGYTLTHEEYLQNQKKTVVVGMSGGVDSSVVAVICKLLGYQTIGLFMKNWDEVDERGVCSADKDYSDVIKVCERIDIPYYSLNFVQEYYDGVFSEFLSDIKAGLTPNPDILCNREIKFKVFFEKAKMLGADFLATGHYAQIIDGKLAKGFDGQKDQSYFLYAISQDCLSSVLFPIGHLEKKRVRELAVLFDLATSTKKDSTGICFIGERNFKQFLMNYVESVKGPFVDLQGKKLGLHDGTCFYTLGQRKGLGIGGPGEAWFVVAKNNQENEVILAQGDDHPALYAEELEATELNWLVSEVSEEFECTAKIRYRQKDQIAHVLKREGKIQVRFPIPQRAITLGQSIVLYQGDVCLGGGKISQIGPTLYDQGKELPEILAV